MAQLPPIVSTMTALLRDQPTSCARFLSHMLARTLLVLARYGQVDSQREIPRISQETLAEMIGTTRSRVNFFMNKFRKMGLIEYNGTLKINAALLSVVLHE